MKGPSSVIKSDASERDYIDRLIRVARAFVRTADEFWPDHPNALGVDIVALEAAIEGEPFNYSEVEP